MAQNIPKGPLPTPPAPASVSADTVTTGQFIPPIERIKIFSPDQWEEFILEWATSLSVDYSAVERYGGAGDMGRDVIATRRDDGSKWDNYQCKHYDHALMPSELWTEFGKLVYYTKRGDYTYPRRYYFVAPQGGGTSLSNLLKKPDKLKSELLAKWDDHCRIKITTTPVELNGDLKVYINGLDFSIFEAIPPLKIIDQHRKTPWHVTRFGGGMPMRPPIAQPPAVPTANEANYVRQLLDAYGDHLTRQIASIGDIGEADLSEHFADSRIEFYSAESLRAFSRDNLPAGQFEILQEEILSGIKDDLRADHPSGYRRVVQVVKTARLLQITAHALCCRLLVRDRGGICHQLANDKKVRWIK